MAPYTAFLVSALVVHTQILDTTAAPLGPNIHSRESIWTTVTSIISVEETVTDVVPVSYSTGGSASATTSPPESTETQWNIITVTARPTDPVPTAVPPKWTLPEFFEDLSNLGINKLAYGSANIAIVTGIPASASASSTVSQPSAVSMAPQSATVAPLPRLWTNTSSAYRIFYPSGSINPGNRPQGGSEFYATPGNLPYSKANNVTLEYSIFFPADFDWVQGGKLPGLYGGHEGCSGGNDAKSCFSTRLMWRNGGAGELYLYAPKDRQTPGLCNTPPQSVCDEAYGLSVGRGSFHFAAGGWTHVSQTVRLNTPGQQNGGFELLVNGQRIMRRDDVFYRDIPQSIDDDRDGGEGDDGDWSLGGLWRRECQADPVVIPDITLSQLPVPGHIHDESSGQEVPLFAPAMPPMSTQSDQSLVGAHKPTQAMKAVNTDTSIQLSSAPDVPTTSLNDQLPPSEACSDGAVGFSGLFFSTFFGGHGESWASPKDQYTWVKDFGMSINP